MYSTTCFLDNPVHAHQHHHLLSVHARICLCRPLSALCKAIRHAALLLLLLPTYYYYYSLWGIRIAGLVGRACAESGSLVGYLHLRLPNRCHSSVVAALAAMHRGLVLLTAMYAYSYSMNQPLRLGAFGVCCSTSDALPPFVAAAVNLCALPVLLQKSRSARQHAWLEFLLGKGLAV